MLIITKKKSLKKGPFDFVAEVFFLLTYCEILVKKNVSDIVAEVIRPLSYLK